MNNIRLFFKESLSNNLTGKLNKDQSFEYQTPGYETCIVPATGTINVEIEGIKVESLGTRTVDVWDGEPEGVYVPSNTKAQFCLLYTSPSPRDAESSRMPSSA